MSGCLLYFIEQDSPSDGYNEADAVKNGMAYALADCGFSRVKSFTGPGKKGGVVLKPEWAPLEVKPLVDLKAQRWKRIQETPGWVGLVGDERPGPTQLGRPRQVQGHWVRLADGNDWLVPVARRVTGDLNFPAALHRDEKGVWSAGEVLPAYRDLWDTACRIWDALFAEITKGRDLTIDVTVEADAAVEALAVNYRVGPTEVELLGLLTTTDVAEVLKALIDWPRVEQALAEQKKTESETVSSTPGSADS